MYKLGRPAVRVTDTLLGIGGWSVSQPLIVDSAASRVYTYLRNRSILSLATCPTLRILPDLPRLHRAEVGENDFRAVIEGD